MATDHRQPGDDDVRNDEAPDPALMAAWDALKAQRAQSPNAAAIDAIDAALHPASDEAREVALLQALEGGHADGLRLAYTMQDAARTAVASEPMLVVARPRHWTSRRTTWVRVSAMLATAAALALFVRGRAVGLRESDTTRGQDSALALVAPAPDAVVGDSTRYAWQAVPDVASYRVAWFDADGREVEARTLSTTELVVTRGDSAASPRVVTWRVEARLLDGRRILSAMQPISPR